MIDPRMTSIVGQRVMIVKRRAARGKLEILGRGIVRVVDRQHGAFTLLIEAVGDMVLDPGPGEIPISDGGLFEIDTCDEYREVIVDQARDAEIDEAQQSAAILGQ